MQAFTAIGYGDISAASINTSNESPLPTLLIASSDSIFIHDIDINETYSFLHGISTPIEMGYLIKESKIFWINELHELLMFSLSNSSKYSKVSDLNGDALGLSIDWIERSLYFIHTRKNVTGTTVCKLDLNLYEKGISQYNEVLVTDSIIAKLEISPFTR